MSSYFSLLSYAFDTDEHIINKAMSNVSSRKNFFIGFSGKIASGKDTIAQKVIEDLNIDYVQEFFAKPLKNELNSLLSIINYAYTQDEAIEKIVSSQNISLDEAEHIVELLFDEIKKNPHLTAYDKTVQLRKAIQYWGTDVRRKYDDKYWIKKTMKSVFENLAEGQNVITTDARFINEADALFISQAFLIRLDVSPEVQKQRIMSRDNITITPENLLHPSETELDNYQKFHMRINTDDKTPSYISTMITTTIVE